MLLAADVGNTNVVFALFTYEPDGTPTIRARWRIATDPRRTGDEYAEASAIAMQSFTPMPAADLEAINSAIALRAA